MANSVSSFYQTLIAAASEASAVTVGTLQIADSVYLDYDPAVPADIGKTLNVPLPTSQTSSIYDAGASDFSLYDVGATTVPITLDKHPAASFIIRSFEQFGTPQRMRDLFLDGALKGIKENINATLAALLTTSKFNANALISDVSGVLSIGKFLQGKTALGDKKVDVDNTAMMSLILPSTPYNNLMDTSTTAGQNWTQALIAGERTADTVRATGQMPSTFGCTIKRDQQMPVTGTAPTRTFTGAYFHKYAIAVTTRRLPEPDPNVVRFFYLDFAGIPVRVQFGWNQLKDGYVVTVDAGYGCAVVRPEFGQIFSIAEASS